MGPQQLKLLLKLHAKCDDGGGSNSCSSFHASRGSSGIRDWDTASALCRRAGSNATHRFCTRVASGFASQTILHDMDSPVNRKWSARSLGGETQMPDKEFYEFD